VAFWLLHLVFLFASQRGAGEPRWLVAVAVGFHIAFNVWYSAPGAANAAAAAAAAGGGAGPGAAVAAAPPLDAAAVAPLPDDAYDEVELGGQGGGENPADAAAAAAGGRETPPPANSLPGYSPPATRAGYRTKLTE
jgi:hypothetical protein